MPDNSSYFEQQKKLLEEEKFNNSIALTNARDNALRTTQASMQAQGFAGTGYGVQMQSDVNNAYLSKQAASDNDYWARLQDLNQAENESNEAKASSFLNRMLGLAERDGNLDPLISNGLITNNNGQYAINENSNYIMNLNAEDRADLEDYINQKNNPIPGGGGYEKVDDLYKVAGYDRGKDASITLGDGSWGVKNELDTYKNMVSNGEIKDGDVALLTHKGDDGSQVFIYYKNGRFYTMNKSQAEELAKQNMDRRLIQIQEAKSTPNFDKTLKEYFLD